MHAKSSRSFVRNYLEMFTIEVQSFNNPESQHTRQAIAAFLMRSSKDREIRKFCKILIQSKNESDLEVWYEFYILVVNKLRRQRRDVLYTVFLQAYLNLSIRKLKWRALAVVIELVSKNFGILDNFAVYFLKITLENDMLKDNSEQDKTLDRIVEFEKRSTIFQSIIQKAAFSKNKIFKELKSERPNISNLNKLATMITETKDQILKTYKILFKLSENNTKTLEIYGAYLIDIENNKKEAAKVYDRLLYTMKDKKKRTRTASLETNHMAIIIMSGLFKERGKVIGVNSEATKLFKMKKTEMVNHPIENLMPKFYAKHHKDFMSRFYREGTSKILGFRRKIFILNKFNFIVGATLYVKIMPSLTDGIHIVGFIYSQELQEDEKRDTIEERKKIKYIMTYEEHTGELQYVCENSYRYLGMKSNISNRMSVFLERNNMKVICPDLFHPDNEYANKIGLKVSFDTSSLISSKKSLLKELSDDFSQINPQNQSANIEVNFEDVSGPEDSVNKSSMVLTSAPKRTPKKKLEKSSRDNNSEEYDLDYLYGTRKLVAQVFHQESFEAGKLFKFVQFQELDLTEDDILEEVPAKVVHNTNTRLKKKYQNKKRKFLLNRLESTYSQQDSNRELQSAQNDLMLKKNSSTLSHLYLLSALFFIILSSIFTFKLSLRFQFKKLTSVSLIAGREANSRMVNMAKVIQVSQRISKISSGFIFTEEKKDSKLRFNSLLLANEIHHLYMNNLLLEGQLRDFVDVNYQFMTNEVESQRRLKGGGIQTFKDQLDNIFNLFVASGFTIVSKAMLIFKELATKLQLERNIDESNEEFNKMKRALFFIEKNGFWKLYEGLDDENTKLDNYFQDEIQSEILYSLFIFLSEIIIFLTIAIVLIPLLNKVSKISRKLFIFMMHISGEDMNLIIRTTNRFIKVYIDQDTIENDSIAALSSDSVSSFSQRTLKQDTVAQKEDIKFEYSFQNHQPEIIEEDLREDDDSQHSTNNKKSLFSGGKKKGILNKKAMGLKSQTHKFTDTIEEGQKKFVSANNNLLHDRLDTEHFPLMTQGNQQEHLKSSGSVHQEMNLIDSKLSSRRSVKKSKEEQERKIPNNHNTNEEINDEDYSGEEEYSNSGEMSYLKKNKEKQRVKIEKFDEDSRPSAYKNVIKVVLVCMFFTLLSLIDYLVNRNSSMDLKWMLGNQRSIIHLESNVNYGYAAVYESIALQKPDYKIEDKLLLNSILDKMADSKKMLIEFLNKQYPTRLQEYKETLQSIMFTDLCTNYFQQIKGESKCNTTLYDSGLDTVVVYLGQSYSNLNRDLARAATEGERQLNNMAKEILESRLIDTIDHASGTVIDALSYINDVFTEGVNSFVRQSLLVTAVLIGTHIFMLLVIIIIMIAFYLRRLDSEYKRLKTLIGMIPLEMVVKDEELKSKFQNEDFLNI